MNVITKEEAKKRGLKRYFTGRPCGRGHIAERQVSSRECCECCKERNRIENMTPEQVTERREGSREYMRDYLLKANMSPAAYARYSERVRNYEISKLRATPAWADTVAMVAIYAEADRLSRRRAYRTTLTTLSRYARSWSVVCMYPRTCDRYRVTRT